MFVDGFRRALLSETPSPYSRDLGAFLSHARLLNTQFSNDTRRTLELLRTDRIKYCQFLNIPVTEAVPPTATAYMPRIPKSTYEAEGVMGAASLELGNLFGYEETSRFVMYDIYPVKDFEDSKSFVNSRKMLSFHSDGSAHPKLSPDYVMLYCLRSSHHAHNLIVDLDELLGRLPLPVVDLLKQPVFRHLVSQKPERYDIKPVLFEENGAITVRYDEDNVAGVDAEAVAAQRLLNREIRNIAISVANTDHSLLIIDNKRSLHARSSFTPVFDGTDRWVKGAFVTKSDVRDGLMLDLPA